MLDPINACWVTLKLFFAYCPRLMNKLFITLKLLNFRVLNLRNYSKRVTDIPNVGFYSLPKKMGRTGPFINDGLRLISLGCKQKEKNTNTVQKPNTVLVAVCHFPPSPYRVPVGNSANNYGSLPSQ